MLEIFGRIYFTIVKGFEKRKLLYNILSDSSEVSTTEISIDMLKQTGASIVVLDYDGVLAPHGVNELSSDMINWIILIITEFSEANIYILTNKPKTSRCAYLRTIFPNIRFITGKKKKPFPHGLMALKNMADCKISDIVLLDDRLLTGGLATCIAGTKFIYIKKPLVSLAHNYIAEVFFIVLRYMERFFVKMAQICPCQGSKTYPN